MKKSSTTFEIKVQDKRLLVLAGLLLGSQYADVWGRVLLRRLFSDHRNRVRDFAG